MMRFVCAVLALLLVGSTAPARAHGSYHERIDALSERIRVAPDAAGLLARASAYRDHGSFGAALDDCRAARVLDPSNTLTDLVEGRTLLEGGEAERALELLERYRQAEPADARGALWVGRCCVVLGRHRDAAEAFDDAVRFAEHAPADLEVERVDAWERVQDGGVEVARARLAETIARLGAVPALVERAATLHAVSVSSMREGPAGGVVPPRAPRRSGVLVDASTPMRYLANTSDPAIGTTWIDPDSSDATWTTGVYPVGYGSPLVVTPVADGTRSVYTRVTFTVADPGAIAGLFIGCDYDDGYVAWLNGIEIHRSPGMPSGSPAWDSTPSSHESSNGTEPDYGILVDVSESAVPALRTGTNVLAVGAWNVSATSSDLVLAPQLSSVDAGETVLTRGPYLQLPTDTSIVVRWRTLAPSDSRVAYGPSPGELSSSIVLPGSRTEHEVSLTGLTPSTLVYYAVGSSDTLIAGGDAAHVFETCPPPGAAEPTRFWVLGDCGTADANAAAVRDAYVAFTGSVPTDAIMLLGDNAYTDGTDAQYQSAVFDMYATLLGQAPVWPTLGNHDGRSADSATQTGVYYDIFTLPDSAQAGGVVSGTEAYYSFDHGNVHMICLESFETDRSPGSPMLEWLASDLAATTAEWTAAFWHHPPYSKGSHDSDTETELVEMRENVLPILEQGGVDLVLSGHSHSYERSFLIDGHYGDSSTLDPTMILDGGDGNEAGDGAYSKSRGEPHGGAVYVVAGSSGKTGGGPLDHPVMIAALNALGSVVLDVDDRRLDVTFLTSAGSSPDAFTILHDLVGVESLPVASPSRLVAVAPSPTRRTTVITFDAGAAGDVTVDVFDTGGRRVRSLLAERTEAGRHRITWDGRDAKGRILSSGVYVVRLRTATGEDHRKTVIVR